MTASERLPDPAALRLLARVAELGSLGRAAQAEGISQPSASARIRTLERDLGLAVLARSPRGSVLTPAGELVTGWAAPLLAAADDLVRGVAALRGDAGDLSVAASLTIAEYLLPTWLARLQATPAPPRVRLEVANSREVIDRILSGTADLGFIESPTVPSSLSSVTVGRDRLLLVGAPGLRWLRRRRPVTADDLAAAPLVLREPGSGTREVLDRVLDRLTDPAGRPARSAQRRPRPTMELSSTAALLGAVTAGVGVSVISELAVADRIRAGSLASIDMAPDLAATLQRRLRAVWRRGSEPSSAARRLLDLTRGS